MHSDGKGFTGLRTMVPPVTPREKIERARAQITIASDALLPAMRLVDSTHNSDLGNEIKRIHEELIAIEERLFARTRRLQEDGQ